MGISILILRSEFRSSISFLPWKAIISVGGEAGDLGSLRTITPTGRMNFSIAGLITVDAPIGSDLKRNDFSSKRNKGLLMMKSCVGESFGGLSRSLQFAA